MTETRAGARRLPNEVVDKSHKAEEELRHYLVHSATRAVSKIKAIQDRLIQFRDAAYAAASAHSQGSRHASIGESLIVISEKTVGAAEEILRSFQEAEGNLNAYNGGLDVALRMWEETVARVRNQEATETSTSTQSDNSSSTTEASLVATATSCDEAAESPLFSKRIRDDVSRNGDLLLSAFGHVTGWWRRFSEEVDTRAKNALKMLAEARALSDLLLRRANLHTGTPLVRVVEEIEPMLQLIRDLADTVSWAESSVKQSCIDQFNEREEASSYAIATVSAITSAVGGRLPGQEDDVGQAMMDDSTP